jgi:Kef-type K+ transport system membrane component KefB
MHEPFAEFAVLLLIAAAVSAFAVRLRQPVLIAYIFVGILVGPADFAALDLAARIASADLPAEKESP